MGRGSLTRLAELWVFKSRRMLAISFEVVAALALLCRKKEAPLII